MQLSGCSASKRLSMPHKEESDQLNVPAHHQNKHILREFIE